MSHTPGPWRVSEEVGGAVVSEKPVEGMLQGGDDTDYYGGYLICESVTRANARLIAAAPDLLEACHAFCRTMAFTPSSIPGALEADLNAAYEAARAAIAKAEGGGGR